ncbi:MAG: PQQ-like beta-propeller repeat protein [Planctomycetia bacterium]|nr:PQQ-like beta-propeller repeat protein [Planctomycetia bacterium]
MPAPKERPLWPPRRVFVGLASLAAATVMVRMGLLEPIVGGIVDAAVRNIITLILGFSAVMSVLVWFLVESGHSATLKRLVGFGLVALVGLACAALRIERVSGDLVPELVFRWSPSRDRLLPQAAPSAVTAAAAWAETPTDFPRFLGPAGSGSLEGPALDPDWEARPPKRLWRRPIGAGWSGFAVCGDHAVTLEQRGDEEIISCQAVPTGDIEWTVSVPGRLETVLGGVGPRSTPTIAEDAVYATGATGWLHAIDGATGRVLWKKNVLDDLGIDPAAAAAAVAWGRAGSPLVAESLVIVPGGGPKKDGGFVSLVAYDRATGERRWTGGDQQISYVSPEMVSWDGRKLVLTVNESSIAGHDPADGRELWRFDWPGHSNSDATCSQAHVLDGGRIFISKGYGAGAAVFARQPGEPATFKPVWQQSGLLKTKFTNVVIHDGHAYGLSDGILECVSLDDGRRRWKTGRYGQGQVLRAGGWLLVQAESGEVVLVECVPEKHVVRGRLAAIDGQTWNTLCLSGDRLLVRNAEEAACYEIPLAAARESR